MLKFPFQAKMTDRLANMLRHILAQDQRAGLDMLPSIKWEYFESGPRLSTWNWMLGAFSRNFMQAEDIITVADITFHLPVDQRHRLTNRVLDWSESEGLVAYEDVV
jgi:hypothetical protein